MLLLFPVDIKDPSPSTTLGFAVFDGKTGINDVENTIELIGVNSAPVLYS
jgi:hypothetical protein